MTFSEILKYIRKQQNYTQEQFARELNVSFSTINRWEMVILHQAYWQKCGFWNIAKRIALMTQF